MVIRNDYSDYGISNIRPKSIFDQDYGMGQWNQPADMWGSGENRDPGMSWDSNPISRGAYPPPSMGPVQDGAFGGMFGNVMAPTMGGSSQGAPPSQVDPPRVNTYERPSETDSLRRFTNAVNSVYSPDFTDRDRLRALMDAAPQREEPGFARRLVAAGMGFRQKPEETLKIQDAVMYAPHRQNMQDWTAKTEPFTKIAEIEGRQNVNERTLAGNMVNAVTQGDRIEQQRVRDEGKQKVAETRAESDRIHREAQAYNLRLGKGWDWDVTGPTALIKNKDTGQVIDTGLKTGQMSEETLQMLKNKGALDAAIAGGGQIFTDRDTGVNTRGNPRDPNAPLPPAGSVPLTGSGSRSSGAGELSVTDTIKLREQAQLKLRDTNTKVEEWTEIKGGKVVLKPRQKEGWIFGKSQAELDAERKEVADMLWSIENGVGDPRNRGKGVVKGASTGNVDRRNSSNTGGTITNDDGNWDYTDLEEGVNPPPAVPKFNVSESGAGPTKEAAARLIADTAARDPREQAMRARENEDLSGIKTAKLPTPAPGRRNLLWELVNPIGYEKGPKLPPTSGPKESPLRRDQTWDNELKDFFTAPNPAFIGNERKPMKKPGDYELPVEGTKENPYTGPLNVGPELWQRATEFLIRAGLTVDQANVEHAIRTGRVQ